MKLAYVGILGFSLLGCSNPPPKNEVVAIEGVACTIAENIPETAEVATYLCSLLQLGPTSSFVVRVPKSQIAAFEATHKIIRLSFSKDAGKDAK